MLVMPPKLTVLMMKEVGSVAGALSKEVPVADAVFVMPEITVPPVVENPPTSPVARSAAVLPPPIFSSRPPF